MFKEGFMYSLKLLVVEVSKFCSSITPNDSAIPNETLKRKMTKWMKLEFLYRMKVESMNIHCPLLPLYCIMRKYCNFTKNLLKYFGKEIHRKKGS